MSIKKTNLASKAAAGVALVALSGGVPQPLMNVAEAATGTISLSGSFITGIKLSGTQNADFGSLAVTSANGQAKLSTAAAVTSTKATAIAGAAAGKFAFTAVNTTPDVAITVKAAKAAGITLAATAGLAGPTGTAKLVSVNLKGVGALTTLAFGGGTTAKQATYDITTKTGTIKMGATVSWGATQPIGQFATPVILTIAF